MPELPEVETVVRLIRAPLLGRRLRSVSVDWERTLGGPTRRAFSAAVRDAQVVSVERRAKYIIIGLKRRQSQRAKRAHGAILVHLRMTGRLHVDPKKTPAYAHTRVTCELDNGSELRFVDPRKFGRFQFLANPHDALESLGPEPLEPGFDADWMFRELRARRRQLKPLLLDQTFLAGLGNIYVDEALHAAGLHPLRLSNGVPRPRAAALVDAIRTTLGDAIEREGSSFDTFYRTPEGQPGSYQHQFQVYGRTGKPCNTCGRAIQRLVVGQRGTHVCTRCQPKPRAVSRPKR